MVMSAKKIECEHCGAENRVGALICVGCHRILTINGKIGTGQLNKDKQGTGKLRNLDQDKDATKPTRPEHTTLNLKRILETDTPLPTENNNAYGTGTLKMPTIRLFVHGYGTDVSYEFARREMMLGRADSQRNLLPEIDLSQFDAYKFGVSRCHALLRRDGSRVFIQDLGSSNGTFLNGKRLNAQSPHIVHDGDTIRLGTLVLQIFFATAT